MINGNRRCLDDSEQRSCNKHGKMPSTVDDSASPRTSVLLPWRTGIGDEYIPLAFLEGERTGAPLEGERTGVPTTLA